MITADLVVPAFDEAASLPAVLAAVPERLVRNVYVIDNGSVDDTARVAAGHGAIVLFEPRRGYGTACARAVAHLTADERPPDVIVFMHADGADDPGDIGALLRPIDEQGMDLVVGASPPEDERGVVRLGDRLSRGVAVTLIRALYGQRYRGVGGFRAIRLPALVALAMKDPGPGWDLEMQVKAVRAGLRVAEVPVRRARRAAAPRPHTLGEIARDSSRMLYTILRHSTLR